jgi:hypothetical protein
MGRSDPAHSLPEEPAMTHPLILRELSKPITHNVVTTYADGTARVHGTRGPGQAENYAIGERRKIGRDLVNRNTGKTVRVVSVDIVEL